jgi:hypothetical protein
MFAQAQNDRLGKNMKRIVVRRLLHLRRIRTMEGKNLLLKTGFFVLLCLLLALPACDIPKEFFFDYDECFNPTEVGQKVGTTFRFNQPVFINPGKFTLRGRVNAVDSNEEIPNIFKFDFKYVRAKRTLVQFQEDVQLTSQGKIPPIEVNFLDPGVGFRKNDLLLLNVYPIDRKLPLSNWNFRSKYKPNPRTAVILQPYIGAPFTITLKEPDEE